MPVSDATTYFAVNAYTVSRVGCGTGETLTIADTDLTDISGGTFGTITGPPERKKLIPANTALHAIYGFKIKVTFSGNAFYQEPNFQYLIVGCHAAYFTHSFSFATT